MIPIDLRPAVQELHAFLAAQMFRTPRFLVQSLAGLRDIIATRDISYPTDGRESTSRRSGIILASCDQKLQQITLATSLTMIEPPVMAGCALLQRTRNLSSPRALRLWVTALIRLRPTVTCNARRHQPNFFV